METDTLNTLVSDAIWRAQELEALGIPTSSAWKEVSVIEEVRYLWNRRTAADAACHQGETRAAGGVVAGHDFYATRGGYLRMRL
jgi:hypothetical protein